MDIECVGSYYRLRGIYNRAFFAQCVLREFIHTLLQQSFRFFNVNKIYFFEFYLFYNLLHLHLWLKI